MKYRIIEQKETTYLNNVGRVATYYLAQKKNLLFWHDIGGYSRTLESALDAIKNDRVKIQRKTVWESSK